MHAAPNLEPPSILQIHREAPKSGREGEYGAIEDETARVCAALGCPHSYLAIESLTGAKEVWFFNGFASPIEQQQVTEAYARNEPLLRALTQNSARKSGLTSPSVNVFARYRADLTIGRPWALGDGRFLVITVSRNRGAGEGTVFEAEDGTYFIVRPARTRTEADAAAASAGVASNVFAVRPSWSMPAREWIAADESLWRGGTHNE